MSVNYFTIPDKLSPHEAESVVHAAKLSGADELIIFHDLGVDPFCAAYREKLLSLFRAAMRHKIKIFLADDSFTYSGTAFGALSSVPDLWSRALFMVERAELSEGEIPLWEGGEKCVVARTVPPSDKYPNSHYPALPDPLAYDLAKDIYMRFIHEYKKFVGYEFCGFISFDPSHSPPMDEYVPYFDGIFDAFYERYSVSLDIPALFSKSAERARYLSVCNKLLEKNYLEPLRKLCEENALSFRVLSKADLTFVRSFKDLSASVLTKTAPCLSFSVFDETAKTLSNIRAFLNSLSEDIPRIIMGSEVTVPEGGCVLVNDADSTLTATITLPEGEYFVKDAEKSAVYEFKSGSYTFSPHAFLCITNEGSSFPDPLPIRVGGVMTCEFGDISELGFHNDGDSVIFDLPDEDLSNKALVFEGDITSLKVKIGSVNHFLISPPLLLPLFDFYRGFSVAALSSGGTVEKVFVASLK